MRGLQDLEFWRTCSSKGCGGKLREHRYPKDLGEGIRTGRIRYYAGNLKEGMGG